MEENITSTSGKGKVHKLVRADIYTGEVIAEDYGHPDYGRHAPWCDREHDVDRAAGGSFFLRWTRTDKSITCGTCLKAYWPCGKKREKTEYKYKLKEEVWIVGGGEVQLGIVVSREIGRVSLKPEYEVRIKEELVSGGTNESVGSVTYSGWPEHRIHPDKLTAAKEVYQQYAEKHHKIGLALQDCVAHYHDPDYIICRLENTNDY